MSSYKATMIGALSLLIWATSPAFLTSLTRIPVFEVLTFILTISFIGTVTKLSAQKNWSSVKQPLYIWIIGTLAIIGNDIAYVSAFRFAPALHIDLISYLWPILLALGMGFLPAEQFSGHYLLGALLGMAAIYLAINPGLRQLQLSHQYLMGYLIAGSGALIWSVYVLASQLFKEVPMEMMGLYCGIGALITSSVHFALHEPTLIPTTLEFSKLVVIGLGSAMIAYFCWDHGIKKGNFKLLSMLSYCTPVLSASLLILTGKGKLTPTLATAYLLVCIGIAISNFQPKNTPIAPVADSC